MIDQIKMVEEFHIKFLQTMSDTPVNISEQEAELRYKLGKEELDEYLTAAKDNDLIEVLDALADQLYILYGTITKHGLQNYIVEAFELVHKNNLAKLGPDGKPIFRADGKIIKPENFKKVELKDVFKL